MAAPIVSITNLQALPNLEGFYADWNALTTVDLSGLANLTYVDISDNEDDGGFATLQTVNLENSVNVLELRVDGSNLSAEGIYSIRGFESLNLLQFLDMDNCNLVDSVDLRNLSSLDYVDLSGNNSLSDIRITDQQPIADLLAVNCSIGEGEVNQILYTLSVNPKENGLVDLTGGSNATPSGYGLVAITDLQAKGWTVNVNP